MGRFLLKNYYHGSFKRYITRPGCLSYVINRKQTLDFRSKVVLKISEDIEERYPTILVLPEKIFE